MKTYHTKIYTYTSIAFTLLWMLFSAQLKAQQHYKTNNEVAVSIGVFTTTLRYDLASADVKEGQGINLGIDYTYYFSKNFGFVLGAEYQRFSATGAIDQLSGAYTTTDYEQETFEFRYQMSEIRETQHIDVLSIPILLTYQNQEFGFFVRGGAKIGIPFSAKYHSTYQLHTSGYYPQYNAELFDPEFMGFGTFDDIETKGNSIDTKPSYMATVEIGIRQDIGVGNLYIGLFYDHGLNDMSKKGQHPVTYTATNTGVTFENHSILNSDAVSNLQTSAFGIKLKYAFWSF